MNRKKIGGKWKPIILIILRDKPARFNKIKQLMPGVSNNMLAKNLKELEYDRLIDKSGEDIVVYTLTEKAHQIVSLMIEIKVIIDSL